MNHMLVGPPPDNLSKTEKSIWYEILDSLPLGTVLLCDRISLEILCTMFFEYRIEKDNLDQELFELLIDLSKKFYLKPEDTQRILNGTLNNS